MFIQAEYYPGTNFSTYSDHGYTWTPAIGGGYYTFIVWVARTIEPEGWEMAHGASYLVWYPGAGPSLPDPNEPTEEPEIPMPDESFMGCRIYINGISKNLIDNLYNPISILGINAPLTIGPKR